MVEIRSVTVKTLTALTNEHLRLKSEETREFAKQMRELTDSDKLWLADRFVREGYATEVMGKRPNGEEFLLAKAA